MSKQKCIYCDSTIKSKQLTAGGVLKDSEYIVFKKSQHKKLVCEECQIQMLLLQLS
jgi:hypothetical protein